MVTTESIEIAGGDRLAVSIMPAYHIAFDIKIRDMSNVTDTSLRSIEASLNSTNESSPMLDDDMGKKLACVLENEGTLYKVPILTSPEASSLIIRGNMTFTGELKEIQYNLREIRRL